MKKLIFVKDDNNDYKVEYEGRFTISEALTLLYNAAFAYIKQTERCGDEKTAKKMMDITSQFLNSVLERSVKNESELSPENYVKEALMRMSDVYIELDDKELS